MEQRERRRRRRGGVEKPVPKVQVAIEEPLDTSSYLDYIYNFPKINPGTFEQLSQESTELEKNFKNLFQGVRFFVRPIGTPFFYLDIGIRSISQREPFLYLTAKTSLNKQNSVRATYFSPTKELFTKIKYAPNRRFSFLAKANFGTESEGFFDDVFEELAVRYHGPSFEAEAMYNNTIDEDRPKELGLSYTQTLTKNIFAGAKYEYSLKHKISTISLATRYDNRIMAYYGTILIPNSLGGVFLPRRVSAGTSVALDDVQSVSAEFYLSSPDNQILDSATSIFYTCYGKAFEFKVSVDTLLRLSATYKEKDIPLAVKKFAPGAIGGTNFSALVDYNTGEFKFGLGGTLQL